MHMSANEQINQELESLTITIYYTATFEVKLIDTYVRNSICNFAALTKKKVVIIKGDREKFK